MLDLKRIQRDLQESLSLDKHPVALLVGAGCPGSIRIDDRDGATKALIPDIKGLTALVKESLAANVHFQAICTQFVEDGNADATIEDMLSRIRLLARVVGNGKFIGLSKTDLTAVEKSLCEQISSVVKVQLPSVDSPYHHLADWVNAISRAKPVELFTTNYDLLLEQALEDRRVPFFDGFVGAREPFFDLRAIEDEHAPTRWVRLWKLHGSISWRYGVDGSVTRSFPVPDDAEGVLIHPSELKYDQSRRMPYLAMIDRLRTFLRQPSAFLVSSGYSFADDHLNEVIIQELRNNPTAAAYGLLYRDFEEEAAAVRVSKRLPTNICLVGKDSGFVRGDVGKWIGDENGDEDAKFASSDLGDFAAFARFLRGLGAGVSL